MSHTVKHTPTGAVCAGRRFKRLQHKRERALVRMALCAGVDADFRLTAGRTHLLGGGKMYRRDAILADLRQ
jgi:hypothetical protein